MAALSINDQIGKYYVKAIIKTNLYTETYKVEDADAHRFFLKLFKIKDIPSQLLNFGTKIVKEIEHASALNHRNIITFVEQGVLQREDGDFQYYVTNYFNGAVLSDIVCREGALSEEKATKIFRELLNGLQYLHTLTPTLLHNDIDPSNVLLSSTTDEAVIIDLGHVSERCSGSVPFDTSDLDIFYHANESNSGIFDEQGDIFSACAIFYYMLTGNTPWQTDIEGNTYKERFKKLWQFRKSNPLNINSLNVSNKCKSVLTKGLALKAVDRFPDVKSIVAYLDTSEEIIKENPSPDAQTKTSRESDRENKSADCTIKKGNGRGFEEIAGMQELKDTLTKQVIFVIKNKDIAEEYKLIPPSGMLLYGPPGCGKTFFAEKFAEETGFNYMLVKASDIASTYIHGTQEKINELFKHAEKNAPIVICFDEFDALVPDRSIWNNHQAGEVNEFLSQMNNCSKRGIFIVATSNRPDKIDPAILRTGRIDKLVYVPLPDFEARKEMFAMYLKGRPQDEGIDIDSLARETEGYIASDIAYIVNDSATIAAYAKEKITGELLHSAVKNTAPSIRKDRIKEYDDIKRRMESRNRSNSISPDAVHPW